MTYGGVDGNDPDRMMVQLAGCLVAAQGCDPRCREGDYGWSPAFEAVRVLRRKYDQLRGDLAREEAGLAPPRRVERSVT